MATVTEPGPAILSLTDEPFVTLVENQFAVAAIEQFADDDGLRLIFLHGPAGNGKSHLVRQLLREEGRKPDSPHITHLTASALIAELDEAIAGGLSHEFRQRYLDLDLLVIEDLSAIERKPETQRQLMAIIDDTLAVGGQVLLTCSKAPGELDGVSPKLINRLHGGACIGISPPGSASRLQLLSTFARARQLTIPADALQPLADQLPVSPRELKAAIARLDEIVHKSGASIVNGAMAERFLGESVAPPAPGISEIARAVAKQFGVTVAALRTGGRTAATALPRQIAMSLARELTGQPLERIAAFFGRQNHGTVIHARKKLLARMEDDAGLRQQVTQIRRRLGVAVR